MVSKIRICTDKSVHLATLLVTSRLPVFNHLMCCFLHSRFLLGVSVALLYVSAYSMIGEVASPHYRGTLTSINELANMSGQLFESVVTILTSSYYALTNSSTILAAFFFPTIWWMIESPYYLTHTCKFHRAKENLKIVRPGYTDDEIEEEFKLLKQSIDTEKLKKNEINWFNFFKVKSVRRPLRCALLLNVFAVSCGGPAMALNVANMLPANQYFSREYYPFISFSIQFVAGIGSTFIIDKFPRRKLYIFTGLLSAAMQAFSAAVYYAFSVQSSEIWKWSFILNNFVYMFVDRGLLSPLNCTVRSEIFPIRLKGIGNALCVICQSLALIVSYAIFDFVYKNYGLTVNFLIFTLFSLIIVATVYAYLPETGNKSLAEVQNAIKMEAEEKKSNNSDVGSIKC